MGGFFGVASKNDCVFDLFFGTDYQHEPTAEADIVICTPVLEREAKEQNKSFRSHLAHLLVHSTLHAQGWDHETDEEAEAMEAREREIMKTLGFPDPYSDRARAH